MTAPKFTKDFFVGNRRALLERSGLEVVVIPAAGLLQRSADTTYTFQQDRNFWYLTGLDQPDVVLVMTPGESFLIEAARSAARQAFDGAGDAASAIASAGIDSTYSERAGWERLSDIVSKLKLKRMGVLTAPASYLGSYGFYTNPSRKRLATRLARRFPNTTQVSVSEQLARLRAQKQPVEIATLQRAIDRTTQSLDIVRTQLDSFQYEYEIEAFLSQQFRAHGDDGHAFEPIIASGAHATTLHYIENNGRLQSGDLLVCDVGAKTAGYCADVTRTFRYGRATARQRAVHEAVLQVQGYALELLVPGTLLRDYESRVGVAMRLQLVKLGLISSVDDREAAWQYYPHATSHFLGLDVHDVGDYNAPLAENMVLTCEPGIYIAAESIGVRIEDDVLITATGNSVLSDCSREL